MRKTHVICHLYSINIVTLVNISAVFFMRVISNFTPVKEWVPAPLFSAMDWVPAPT